MRCAFPRILLCFLAVVLPAVTAFSEDPDLERLTQGNTQFAVDLYHMISDDKQNLVFSPYSISLAMAMAYGGARGQTAAQIVEVLRFPVEGGELHVAFSTLQNTLGKTQLHDRIYLSIVNAFWPQEKYPFLDEYMQLVKSGYSGEILPVDYMADPEAARKTINTWVENETAGKIPDIIPYPILPTTRWMLTNAVYFKGEWLNRFDEAATSLMPFYIEENTPTQVHMMHTTAEFDYAEDERVQVLELPYAGEELSMFIALPREIEGLQDVEQGLTADGLRWWSANLQRREIEVYLPRFKMEYAIDLIAPLKVMGIVDAFSREKADFSGLDGRRGWLYIEIAEHKAFMETNEEGTEAAAATAVGCFPAGVGVLTDKGLLPIETVDPGMTVIAYDLENENWTETVVLTRQSVLYSGDMITIEFGGDSIESTGNQPFFVLRGDGLSSRPLPQEISEDEHKAVKTGRWVEARDLRAGDVLRDKSSGGLTITGLSSRNETTRVYCLDVAQYHNCAMHKFGILAHNEGKKEAKPEPIVFRADHPFLFFVRDRGTGTILFMGRVVDPSTD